MTTDSKLILAGQMLANIAFNMKQQPNKPLPAYVCESMDECQRSWDEALAAHRSEQTRESGVKDSLTAQPDRRELVNIVWNDADSDWPWFYMLDTKPGWVKLKGADFPDGSGKHRGDVFWTPESAIKAMSATE